MIREDTQGLIIYEDLTSEEAAAMLADLPPAVEAANRSHADFGGDYNRHLAAHQKHRERLAAQVKT